MIRIVFESHEGARREVGVAAGVSLMEAAVRNGVREIEGECGGAAACATCHIYVPEAWRAITGVASEHERAMLECAEDVDERSRLGCQIKATEAMDGMMVFTPRSQR